MFDTVSYRQTCEISETMVEVLFYMMSSQACRRFIGSVGVHGQSVVKLVLTALKQQELHSLFHLSPKMTARNISRFWEWGKKIICVGRNYVDHAKELKNAVPTEPVLFLKPPSAYVKEGSPILVPGYTSNLHHEVELGVVIGKGGTAIPQSSAMEHVAGYALCLDMTARDIQDECKSKGLPWTLAKAFDTSCPVSDFIPKERIPEPGNVKLWLKVNEQLRQSGCTSQMVFSIPYLISYISDFISLEEGDLILTGTPKGVSAVHEHDELQAGIEDVVTMSFRVDRKEQY